MKKQLLILLALIIGLSTDVQAGKLPKWYKKARKAELTIISIDAQGGTHQSQAYFIDEKGTAICEYDILKGAVKASVIDAEGQESDVAYVGGASSLYNVAKLSISVRKAEAPTLCTTTLKAGQTVYIMPLAGADKKAEGVVDTITAVADFGDGKYPYYTLSRPIDERYACCPVFSEEGELIGHLQLSANSSADAPYVISSLFGKSLSISALDANNSDLRAIGITKDVPDDEAQANSYLFLTNKRDANYAKQVERYIQKFPNSATGYICLAEHQAANGQYKEAEQTYAKGLEMKTGHDDELHHSFAKLLYQVGLQDSIPSEGWTMDHALEEANAAFAANPLPLYTALEGLSLYALRRYEEAYQKFIGITTTNMRSAEYFIYAAQCKQVMQATDEEILALQDSALACYAKPLPVEAANYLYLRAQTLTRMKRYRDAVNDLNNYEHLQAGNVSAQFLYEREQVEIQARLFPAALNDIERAVKLLPDEPMLRAEEASLNYRVGQLDEAIAAAREAIRISPDYSDGHRLLGICLRDKGQTVEAKKSLQRAAELGDTIAKSVLEKMQ